MKTLQLTSQEKEFLKKISTHSENRFLRDRARTIFLIGEGYPQWEIAHMVGIREETVSKYKMRYINGGWDDLGTLRFTGRKDSFAQHQEELCAALEEDPPDTLQQARDKVENTTGRRLSLTGVSKLLKRLKIKRRKVRQAPPQPKGEEKKEQLKQQRKEFMDNTLMPSLQKALEGEIIAVGADAAHFVHSPQLGYIWSRNPKYLQATPGRKRFSVLGAVNVVT